MSSQTGNTKLLVPILLAAVLAGASVAIVPFAAFAQTPEDQGDNSTVTAPQENATQTGNETGTLLPGVSPDENATATENTTATGPEANATETGNATTIQGTIRVNATTTIDDIDPTTLATPEANATQIATAEVTNGTAINTQLDAVQGFAVYSVTVVDAANQSTYHVFVDPANGNVLYTSPAIPATSAEMQSAQDVAQQNAVTEAENALAAAQNAGNENNNNNDNG
jgi:uncharacterized membrane protein YkoI